VKKVLVNAIQTLLEDNVTNLTSKNAAYDQNFYGKTNLWCTYTDSGNTYTIDSADEFEHDHATFAIYATNDGDIDTTSESLLTNFTASNLSVTGYNTIEIIKTMTRGPIKEPRADGFQYWHVDIEYRIVTSKNRS